MFKAVSQNGYRVKESSAQCRRWNLPLTSGPRRWVYLSRGHIGFILAYFIVWFDERVEDVNHENVWDDWGWSYRPVRGMTTGFSNHASGTAVDINATQHPLGVRGTFRSWQFNRINFCLENRLKGVLEWGGNYQNRADEMHFEAAAIKGFIGGIRARLLIRRVAKELRQTSRGKKVMLSNPHYMPHTKR